MNDDIKSANGNFSMGQYGQIGTNMDKYEKRILQSSRDRRVLHPTSGGYEDARNQHASDDADGGN